MKTHIHLVASLLALSLATATAAWAQTTRKPPEQLGWVSFANSCTPAAQATFERAVALLHSFWWREGEKPSAHAVVLKDADPRRWGPEAGTIRLQGRLPVPAQLPRGSWKLALQLADPSDRLRNDSRYAIRLANEDISFSEPGGWNILGLVGGGMVVVLAIIGAFVPE